MEERVGGLCNMDVDQVRVLCSEGATPGTKPVRVRTTEVVGLPCMLFRADGESDQLTTERPPAQIRWGLAGTRTGVEKLGQEWQN
jgi:hypothetical protein